MTAPQACYCRRLSFVLTILLAASVCCAKPSVLITVPDFPEAAPHALAADETVGQAEMNLQNLDSKQLQALDTGFSKLLLQSKLAGSNDEAQEEIPLSSADPQDAQVSTAGAYLNRLVRKLHREVYHNEAERIKHKYEGEAYGYEQDHDEYPADEHYEGYRSMWQPDREYDYHNRHHYDHTSEYEYHGPPYEEYPYTKRYKQPSRGHSRYSMRVRAESVQDSTSNTPITVCLQEAHRSDCASFETTLEGQVPAKVAFKSELSTCAGTSRANTNNEETQALVELAGLRRTSHIRLQQAQPGKSGCTWKLTYQPTPEEITPTTSQIGHGVAVCRLYGQEAKVACGGRPCADLHFKAQVGVFKTYAVSEHPPLAHLHDSTCHVPTNVPGRLQATISVAARPPRSGQHIDIASQDRRALHNAIEGDGADVIYGGEAIIFTGQVVEISTQLDTGRDGSRFVPQSGLLEYVASFSGRRLTAPETLALPEDTPFIRPDAYKLLLQDQETV